MLDLDLTLGQGLGLGLSLDLTPAVPPPPPAERAGTLKPSQSSPIGSLVWRPAAYSRNGTMWLSARSWASQSKKADIAALKQAKATVDPAVISAAADDVARLAKAIIGRASVVTSVACGHSRREDCFGKQLAQTVAARIGSPFLCCFADRFVSGVSHPKEFKKLPPLEMIADPPDGLVLLVDDVATSGWHMEEALGRLRASGCYALGLVWIAGTCVLQS